MPTNDITRTIDYDVRFMITDNPIHPRTYEVSKVEDTFPLGLMKVTLVQDHYNVHTDVCKEIDGKMYMVCNYYKSSLPPIINENKESDVVVSKWYLSSVGEKLYINSTAQVIYALNDENDTDFDNQWTIELDGELYTFDELTDYLELIKDEENNSLTIKAVNKDLAGYILKVSIGNKEGLYYDFVEMEVVK